MPSSGTSTPSQPATSAPDGAPNHNDGNVELKNMASPPSPRLPIEDDIMQLARLGEIGAIQKLFDEGKYDATYTDEQGITPLHWAAINNHYAMCHFLIQCGANINAKGGDAVATPVLWAAKRCHYYVVHLLLQHGADPLLTDDQGFNLLHSATLDGNVFQLVLLLHQDLPVDIPDAQGHTSLMWAAYKGFPACVDLFLRWGANVYTKDDQGFTALHWALVKGSMGCIQKLVEYGSDRFAENNEHKTPAITAKEMNTSRQWHRALSECGYNPDGTTRYFPLSFITDDRRMFIHRFFYLWPFLILLCVLYILSHMVIFAAVPIALVTAWSMQWVAQQLLRWAPPDMKHIHKTPFFAGIFSGTLFWVGVRWATKILPVTFTSSFFSNLLFGIFFGLCGYFYFSTMIQDPGFVPKARGREQQKAIIEELIEAKRFDEHHFCVKCLVRKPIRSKHCNRCGRCVAKEDHHCPWVDNCVGNNNHRHFLLYVINMTLGILFLLNLTVSYLSVLPDPEGVECNILSSDLCTTLHKDPFTIVLAAWAAVQLVWVTMLLIVQLLQIARGLTTYESMKGYSHGHGAAETITSFVTTGSTTLEGAQVGGPPTGTDANHAGHQHQRQPHQSAWDQWKRLLGLDTFMATAFQGSSPANNAQQRGNPFSRGVLTNCKDFWGTPGPVFGKMDNGSALLGGDRVDYTQMYETPARMTMRRMRQDGGHVNYVSVNTDEGV